MCFDTNNFNNVFDSLNHEDQVFDTVFGAEEDDLLMDAIIGFNESGETNSLPDDDELHLNDDGSYDLDDYLGPNNDTSNEPITKPNCNDISDDDIELIAGNESESEDFYGDEDDNYQNHSDNSYGADPDDLEGSIEGSIGEESYDLDDDFFEESDEGDPGNTEYDEDEFMDEESYDLDDDDFLDESSDEDDEDELIKTVENDKGEANVSLNYDTDDEELIDLVDGSN